MQTFIYANIKVLIRKYTITTAPRMIEHGCFFLVSGSVFVVPHQREAPGGELYPDLVAPSGVEADPHQGGIGIGEAAEFQPCGLDPGPLPLYHEDLVFPAVLKQQILPVPGLRRCAVDQSHVFFPEAALLDGPAQGCSGFSGPGIHHDPSYIFVQPVDGEDLSPQLLPESGRDLKLGVQAHRLADHCQIPVRK